MSLLYPQLPPKRARSLVDGIASSTCRELENWNGDHQSWTIRSATGGASATDEHVRDLRTAIRKVGKAHGYVYGTEAGPPPLEPKQRGDFDAALGRCLAAHLDVSANEASKPGLWCYLGCVIAPELIRWRFWAEKATTAERFLGSRARNMYSRVWWRALLLRDDSRDDPLWLLEALGEDELVQITERPNVAGFRPLAVALGRCLVTMWNAEMPVSRTALLRDVMKRVLRLMPLTAMEMLEADQVEAEVTLLYRESLRSLGVVLDEPVEEAPVAPWDGTLRWSAVSRERRYALVEALPADKLAQLEPLVDRTLPDHREYEPRWKLHHQLDASLQQVVGLVGDILVPGIGAGGLGPWLAEEPVGAWAAKADPRRAAQLIDTLTKADLERLFTTLGWTWPAGLTWSDAQRQLRRRYNGGWDELLLALDANALAQIVARMGGDPTLRGDERLRTIARWLLVDPMLDWPAAGAEEVVPAPTPAPAEVRSVIAAAMPAEEGTDTPIVSPALSSPMPEPPSFIKNTLIRAGIHTVGELLELDAETLESIPGVGRAKIETVVRFQAEVANGLMASLDSTGQAVEPEAEQLRFDSLDELDRWLFQALDGRLATAFALRFDGSANLAEVGDALGVSRERARQLVNAAVEVLHKRAGTVAEAMLIEHAGLSATGLAVYMDDPPRHLAALACVATRKSWFDVRSGLAWRSPRSSLDVMTEQLRLQVKGRLTLSDEEIALLAADLKQVPALIRVLLIHLDGWIYRNEELARKPANHAGSSAR